MFSLIKIFLVITITLVVLLTNLSCHRTPIEPEKTKVNLIYEDALCTEAYFRLKTTEINYPARVDLYLNKNKVNCFTTFSDDTVFVIENLLPKKNYTSYVRVYPEGGREIVSSEVSFVTMDTTSHNFTWQVFEFGNCGNSVLFDVAIIDENNIWAVGEIYMRDSLGRCDPNAYNAVHWDGSKWELKRIIFYTFCPEGTGSGSYHATSIFALDKENIVISSGSQLAYMKNNVQVKRECIPVSINKLWGTSSNDLYAVGVYGNIAHWDGRRWKKIESGVSSTINDIFGYVKNKSEGKEYEILCAVSDKFGWAEEKILVINNNIVDSISLGIVSVPQSVWSKNGLKIYACGDGAYERINGKWRKISGINPYFKNRIRGNDYNDIIIVGDYGMVAHFNGNSWLTFRELISYNGINYSLSYNGKVVAIVGLDGNKAKIIIGKR